MWTTVAAFLLILTLLYPDKALLVEPCPRCDSSVCGYCSDKLLHDACCCASLFKELPPQCYLADCRFLHANSCSDHILITRCCCNKYCNDLG